MKQIQLYQNTLQTLLSEILQNNKEKKIIVLGVRRISAVIFCALKSIHGDVAYFLDNESEQEVEGNRVFFDRPVFSVHHLLYEDLDRIAVINSLHYIEETEELVSVFGLKPAHAATLLLVTKFYDAVSDPVMGLIADRTHSKWGKYRPWLLWMALPFAMPTVFLRFRDVRLRG